MRRSWLLRAGLILVILAGFGLRTFRLDGQSLWYDEAVTANLAQGPPNDLLAWTANDIQPPLYYLLVAGWGRLAGWSEWSLRFVSLYFGVLAVALLVVVAHRLTDNSLTALVAALLAALHPLLLYYSQEARMYTLLTALGIGLVYCALRMVAGDRPRWATAGYILTGAAAIYTHYFAFFLLLALVIAVLFEPTNDRITERRPFLLANLAILVLYLPWFGALFTRLAVDRSYWQGEFKFFEALRSVALRFTSGETVTETTGVWLLLPYALITLWALWRLGRAKQTRALWYAGLWLLLPIAGVLALAATTPKFNARYVLIALPGLLLLWSGGLTTSAPTAARIASATRSPTRVANSLLVALLVAGALFSNYQWFFNLAFTKDQWRELVAFLRPRIEANEKIVLVSGHAWPAWRYYAPDLPVTRLPAIDVLDVDAVLSFENTAAPLRAAFTAGTNENGAWLVEWQDEVVDPTGIAPVQLELGGREKGQSATFWGLKLRRFSRIRPERIVDAPPITQPLTVQWGDQLTLLGYHLMENGDLLLFWQGPLPGAPTYEDYQIAGETLAADGAVVATLADRRPAAYTYPVARWGPGEVVMGHIPATDWLGPTPAVGTYRLHLTVYGLQQTTPQPLTTADGRTAVDLPVTIEAFD